MPDSPLSLSLDVSGEFADHKATIDLALAASAGVSMPGLVLAIERMTGSVALVLNSADGRLALSIEPRDAGALAGSLFPAPKGALAELDIGTFSGGGYLDHPDERTWRGAVTARIGPIAVDGFAIITVGGGEFSLLVLLTAEFIPPIQLSFGFTLVGVGGMVGINRRPEVPALQQAVGSGDLSRLLFPSDAAADAPRLLPVLDSCFPESAGDFVVGPMLKIGWGTPTLVSATIGVLIASSGVIILGRVAITLPFEEVALIRLQAVVLGVIDGTGLTIAASLADSHIVGIPVEGDVRLRIRTGDNALFALSAGGFHPAFTPPDGMAGMNRLAMEISPGPILRVRLAAYLAVTTNSVQFGAAAELTAGVGGFGIHGHFSFDALIIFDPFCFRADLSASVSVEAADFDVASIGLHGQFSGPAPYRINGHASISLLFFDVDVDIPEISWGPAVAPALPPARDPVAVLAAELGKAANWTPSDQPSPLLARLHPNAVRANFTAVHPMGQIQFRQSAVPLDIQLQRMDAVPLPAPITTHVTADDEQTYTLTPLPQQFPPAQFFTRDDKAKLSSAGYASCNGGFDVNATGADSGTDVQTRDLTAECYVLGKGFRRMNFESFFAKLHPDVPRFLQRPELEAPRIDPKVTLRDPGAAVIAGTGDLTEQTAAAATAAGVSAVPTHAGLAVQFLDQLSAVNADAGGDLQAVSAWEVAAQ